MKLSIIIDNLIPASQHSRDIMTASVETRHDEAERQARRAAAMAVLAHCCTEEIAERLGGIALPAYADVREAENGLDMGRGRIGGDGAPFNLGEATVSRAAVRLASGEVGFGYALGRDREKARMIALCDALLQSDAAVDAVEAEVIAPLRAAISGRRGRKAAETA